jgi:hypothetical protein
MQHANRKHSCTVYVQSFVVLWPLFQFLDVSKQAVGHLGQGISPSQGRYLCKGQHKHRINANRHLYLKWYLHARSQRLSVGRPKPAQTMP